VLAWAAAESGISRTGPYLVMKGLGSRLGYMAAAVIATWTVSSDSAVAEDYRGIINRGSADQNELGDYNYSILAYTFCTLCALGGVALAILPSPRPPMPQVPELPGQLESSKPNSSGNSAPVASLVCKERFVVLVGAFLLMMEQALQIAAMTLLTDSVSAGTAHDVLMFYYALSIPTLVAAMFLARALPPAEALAVLFSIGAVGCAGMAVFFASGGSCLSLLWVSYGCLCAMAPAFSLTFSLVASLAKVSGRRSAVLSCGAALGSLATAALSVTSPGMLWLAFTAVLISSMAGVLALRGDGAAP